MFFGLENLGFFAKSINIKGLIVKRIESSQLLLDFFHCWDSWVKIFLDGDNDFSIPTALLKSFREIYLFFVASTALFNMHLNFIGEFSQFEEKFLHI